MNKLELRYMTAGNALIKAGLSRSAARLESEEASILDAMSLAKHARAEAPHMAEELQAALDALGLLLAIIK